MIRLKKHISILFISTILVSGGFGQNLFDADNSKNYARFLQESQQFDLASIELERILFMEPNNQSIKQDLILSLRKSNEIPKALDRLNKWYPKMNADSLLAEEWIKLLLLNHSFPQAGTYLKSKRALTKQKIEYYLLATHMLEGNWSAIETIQAGPKVLMDIYTKQQAMSLKRPGIALGLSALVPGLGKVYSKDWKDGLISLLFVATNAWQSYRGFKNNGIQSVYGWIFGTMAVGFYGSNLYGSWKSAENFNLRFNNDLHNEIEEAVYTHF